MLEFIFGFIVFSAVCIAIGSVLNQNDKTAGRTNQIVCPHCQTRGTVTTKSIQVKTGISGAKATGAVLTGGLSVLATGLSKKQAMTEAHCSSCGQTYRY